MDVLILSHQGENAKNNHQPPRWATSNGNAGNKALVSSGFPAAMLVRHQAASSNCSMTQERERHQNNFSGSEGKKT